MRDYLQHLIEPEQRSEAWHDLRISRFTGSHMYRLMTPVMIERDMTVEELAARPKKGVGSRTTLVRYEDMTQLSTGAISYVKDKVAEALTNCVTTTTTAATDWGETYEPEAKQFFTLLTGIEIREAIFVPFSTIAGCTPDGYADKCELLDSDCVVEVKCPYNSANQVSYLEMNVADLKEECPEYYWQTQTEMLFTKRMKCLLLTYDPRMPDDQTRMRIMVVHASPEDQNKLLIKLDLAAKEKERRIEAIYKNFKPLNLLT